MEPFEVPPELQQILVAAFSGEKTNQKSAMLLWVINAISSVLCPLPLFTQVQTFRCNALTDAVGQHATFCSAAKSRRIGTAEAKGRSSLSTPAMFRTS